jgi:3-isopropylmalate/(R)-2-methylmalate dehydratase large subunit
MGILAQAKRLWQPQQEFCRRMGHTGSEVYLAGPAVAAESAVRGYIAQPD